MVLDPSVLGGRTERLQTTCCLGAKGERQGASSSYSFLHIFEKHRDKIWKEEEKEGSGKVG